MITMEFDYKKLLKDEGVKKRTASFNKRVMAYIVDMILFFFITVMLFYTQFISSANIPETLNVNEFMNNSRLLTISFIGFYAVMIIFWMYLALCESLLGYTFGKKIFGLRVVDKEYNKISVYQALLRNLTKSVMIDFLLFDIMLMIFDKKHRRVSDFILKTLVVINGEDMIKTHDLTNIV